MGLTSGTYDPITVFTARVRRVMVDVHRIDPAVVDRNLAAAADYTRGQFGGRSTYVKTDGVDKRVRNDAILSAHESGQAVKEIARRFGLSASSVYSLLR